MSLLSLAHIGAGRSIIGGWLVGRIKAAKQTLALLPCLWIAAGAASGIYLQEWLQASSTLWASLLALTLLVTAFRWRPSSREQVAALLTAIAVSLAGWHHTQYSLLHDTAPLTKLGTDNWEPVVFDGVVDGIPRWRPDLASYRRNQFPDAGERTAWQTLFEVRVTQVRDGKTWRPVGGKLTVTVDGSIRTLLPGDRVRIFGKWQRIPEASNPGQFDLAEFYALKGQTLRARAESVEQVEKLGTATRFRLDRPLAALMERGDVAMHRYVGRDQARLASALILGQREQVEWDLQESLLATGTMHMLAISGMHVEMIALSVMAFALLIQVPRRPMLILIAVVVVSYSILCGLQPPVMRAAVLVVATCIGRWFGRSSSALNILGLSAIILMAQRSTVVFDVGAQLSYLAVATLIVAAGIGKNHTVDPLDKLILESRPVWQQRTIQVGYWSWLYLKTSAWVWLLTAPMILVRFHVFSPIAIILNLVLWIPLFGALLSGLGVLVLGTWLPVCGWIFGGICTACLWFVQQSIAWGEWVPGGHLWLPAPSMIWMVGFYFLAILLWCVGLFRGAWQKRFAMVLMAWLTIGLIPLCFGPSGKWPLWPKPDQLPLRVTFIDVGHGTSVLIQTPRNQAWLYDAGRMGDMERSYMAIASVLWQEQLAKLDEAYLSHADADHYNALKGIAKRFSLSDLTTTRQVIERQDPMMQEVLTELKRRGVRTSVWQAGTELNVDGVRLRTIHPPPQGVTGTDNANSLCLIIEYGGRKILLPGDLESPGTELIMNQPRERIDVMMAPHHGSLSAKPERLLDWCQPQIVVISGGERATTKRALAPYDSPNRLTFVTARDNAIRITIPISGPTTVARWHQESWDQITQLD